MAQKTVIHFIDDIDGSKADETLRFSIDGGSYEIDLSNANAMKLRAAMRPFMQKARKAPGSLPRGVQRLERNSDVQARREKLKAIREWAKQQSPVIHVCERGRIPINVEQAYDAAHS
ncbi:histone-like nucleoid-structuring protein Lsr2 [Spirillospora sp. CA-294931]|uniref:histone-like nucleoid-structuring protein Lsr2 n=1 Tax=Spirillospora sp. CA-294931 TaxID=3240042 RepID=UPI003D8E02F7